MDINELVHEIWIYLSEIYRIDVDLEDIESIILQYWRE